MQHVSMVFSTTYIFSVLTSLVKLKYRYINVQASKDSTLKAVIRLTAAAAGRTDSARRSAPGDDDDDDDDDNDDPFLGRRPPVPFDPPSVDDQVDSGAVLMTSSGRRA